MLRYFMYAIETGGYESRVLAVCEEEETAKAWLEAIKSPDGDDMSTFVEACITKIPLLPQGVKPYKVTLWRQYIVLPDDGEPQPCTPDPVADEGWAFKHVYEWDTQARYCRPPFYSELGGTLEVEAFSEAAVCRIVKEKIAEWRAGAFGKNTDITWQTR